MDSSNINKTATIIAMIVGITQIFGFFFSDGNSLKALIVFLFIINLLFLFMLQKQKNDHQTKTIEYKKQISKLDLELYDAVNQLEQAAKRDMEKHPAGAKEALERGMSDYVSKLSEILTLHSGDNVNVTLRLLKEDDIKDVGDATVIPIALSNSINTSRKRVFNAGQAAGGRKVRNNSDFQFICDDRITTYFYAQDLTKSNAYQNENLQYADFYKGKIVLPINYHGKNAKNYGYYHKVGENYYSTLGFIIADTLNTKLFTDELKDYYLNLLELYAKQSAVLLYDYKYCIKKIEAEENEVETK